MQNIPIADEKFQKITSAVRAAGFADVQTFLDAFAEEPIQDPRGPLSETELAASLEMIHKSEEDIEAGRFRDMREAMLEIADKHGFTVKS